MTYRDERVSCPSCEGALVATGMRFVCEHCGGVLVRAQELEQMLYQMSPDDSRTLDQRLSASAARESRTCPRCATTMTSAGLEGVTIDRCVEHGVWFDGKELALVLERHGAEYADRERDREHPLDPVLVADPISHGEPRRVHRLARWLTASAHAPIKPKDV